MTIDVNNIISRIQELDQTIEKATKESEQLRQDLQTYLLANNILTQLKPKITSWRELKKGDIVHVHIKHLGFTGRVPVVELEDEDYTGEQPFAVRADDSIRWVRITADEWYFVRRGEE